jgi:type I restriction enzyme S subunit
MREEPREIAVLEECLESVIDYRGKTPPKSPSGIPTITAANVKSGRIDMSTASYVSEETYRAWTTRGFPQVGDVLITTEAPVGEVAPFPGDQTYLITRRVFAMRGKEGVLDSNYLLYTCLSPVVQDELASRIRGSTVPRVLKTDILGLRIPLPQLPEQRAIAHILGTLDDKIELNRKTNETLEAMARALFQSWFVDFDPVRAKAEGLSTGLPDEISELFPDSFEDSELGEIPSGWKVGCLSDCCEIIMGQSPPGDTYNEDGEGLPFYQGKTDFGFRFPGRRVYCSSPTRQASIGATLISVRAPVGSANIAREVCSIGRGIAALKSRQSADSFIYYLVGTLQGVFESYNSEGTVFGAINGKDLASIQIVAPSTEAIAAFNSECLPMDESIQSNTLETDYLTTIRDTLLPKLISGEIRIPDAERMLEEVGV